MFSVSAHMLEDRVSQSDQGTLKPKAAQGQEGGPSQRSGEDEEVARQEGEHVMLTRGPAPPFTDLAH